MNMFFNKMFVSFLEKEVLPGSGYTSFRVFRSSPEVRKAARQFWKRFVKIRQAQGLCLSCDRKHRPDEQRCAIHKESNRKRCLRWARRNRAFLRLQYAERVAAGVCASSPTHGRATSGTLCETCRIKRRSRRAIMKSTKEKP